MPRLKILYYNWTDYDDPLQRGGGVSIYQRNLIDAAERQGDDTWFLCSGTSYSPFSARPFIREVSSNGSTRKFELVNSPILSPGQAAFGVDMASEPRMEAVFAAFLRRHGPFDVIHFNNLEGIPASFLRLAREHAPATRIIYSVHNYFAFCPQVNLWFQEKRSCQDFRDGRKCVNCLPMPLAALGMKWRYRIEYSLRMVGIRPTSLLGQFLSAACFYPIRLSYRVAKYGLRAASGQATGVQGVRRKPTGQPTRLLDPGTAARFAGRRQQVVAELNSHVDQVLAVSGRVAELTVQYGVHPSKVRTEYIGTRFASRAGAVEPASSLRDDRNAGRRGALRILYPGYMRHDKGFYFYLKALEKMPARLANRLHLVFATKVTDPYAFTRIRTMSHRFDAVTFYNGYTHAQLPQILADVDLGVIPVMWEDNLPQVAIECVGSGVPVLTSDRGGARELLDCPELVFKAGSRADLYRRLEGILNNPGVLRTALANRRPLVTTGEHYERLRSEVYLTKRFAPATAAVAAEHALTATADT